MQKSASLSMDKFPLLILRILAGFEVSALIIVSNLTDPL